MNERMSKLDAARALIGKTVEVTTPSGETELGVVTEVYDTVGISMLRVELASGRVESIHPTALIW